MLRAVMIGIGIVVSGCAEKAAEYDHYPNKPINIIVPYGPGGTTDVFARAFARVIGDYLPGDAPIIVVNKPGGSSTIGVTALMRAKADGFTIAMLPTGVLEVQPHLKRVRWTLDDFEPVIGLLEIPAALNVVDDNPLSSFDEWLTHVRANPNQFMYSTSGGVGSSTHIAMQSLQKLLDLQLRWIPFEGEAASRAALLGRKIHGNFSIPTIHKGGELRPLVFLTPTKPTASMYEFVPTLKDLGYDYQAQFPLGVIAKKDTPASVLALLHEAFKTAMSDPQIQKLYQTYDLSPTYLSPKEFHGVISLNAEIARGALVDLGMIR